MARFTAERRERFLTLLETGRNVEQAAADVGVNPSTVARWAARGRADATAEAREFAERFDAIRGGDGERLSEQDVIRALELAIRKGSVTAMKTWLDRYGEREESAPSTPDEFDELRERRRTRAG
jgi:transposase